MNRLLKYRIYALPLLFLAVTVTIAARSYSEMTREVFSFAVNQRVVLIDAGHGGWDAWWNWLPVLSYNSQ